MRRLLVPASAIGVALIAAACGGSGQHARAQTFTGTVTAGPSTVRTRAIAVPATPAEIERAAMRTAAQPGFSARLRASVRLPQVAGNSVSAVGSGTFDPRSSSGTLGVAVELPGLLALAGPLPTQVRLVGGEVYVQIPPGVSGELGSSDAWLKEEISVLGLGNALNPPDVLREVARDATREVPGQRARVTIDRSTGLLRTIVISYAVAGGYRVHVSLTLTGFSAQPATVAPSPARTGELQAALRRLGF